MSAAEALPTTLAAWELALVDRFLRVGECGDASPLRSFEITGETLATAFPDAKATSEDAMEAFRTAIRTDPRVFDAFRAGTPWMAGTRRPECFGYLCASLLIDTLLDGAYSAQGQYRDRLRLWLGTSRTMMQLPGIAAMWHDLETWLQQRIAAGEPYRSLILPNPRTWTQIGHTRRLSFPTRSDIRFLERILANFPKGASDPPGLIRAIEAVIDRDGASWGLESAFAEFREAYRAGGASTSHRFWRLVLRAAKARSSGAAPMDATLELEFDEDGRPGFWVDGAPVPTLASAMRSIPVVRSANLAAAAQRGVVFLRQVGMARWVAEADPPPGRVLIGLALGHGAIARGTAACLTFSGDWLLAREALPPGTVDDLLSRLCLTALRRERLINVSVESGVHTGGGMLGRKRYLPRIVAAGRTTVVHGLSEGGAAPPVASCRGGQMVAEGDLEGAYELSVLSSGVAAAPEWTRRIRFLRDAVPHRDLGEAATRDAAILEWIDVEATLDPCEPPKPADRLRIWEENPSGIQDLLEAIYATGRSGLGDADVVDLVSRAGPPAPVWDVLRAIQESGFLTARRRARWRGRCWTLEPITLSSAPWGTLLEGATCSALEAEFRQVSEGAGGQPFRSRPLSDWSPPAIGAYGVQPEAIADVLGWSVRGGTLAASSGRGTLETSDLQAPDHVLASSWDWTRGRMVVGPVPEPAVSITRWAHPGGRDHDQYRVTSRRGESRHATRCAAILQGHVDAGVPLFHARDGLLVRTAAEGALPIEVARLLRRSSLSGGGPMADGGYAYPLDKGALRAFAAALPDSIDGLPVAASGRGPASAMTLAFRRNGGRTRLRWVDGGISAA